MMWASWSLAAPAIAGALLLDIRRRRLTLAAARAGSLLDVAALALAAGYAAVTIGRAVSAGRPTAILEAALAVLLASYVWQRGTRAILRPLADGVIAGECLTLGGLTRLAAAWTSGADTSARWPPAVVALGGVAILVSARRRFRRTDPVRRVLDHVVRYGSGVKPEYHRATPECPHPERWRMLDTMTAELEVLDFLRALVTTTKPALIVETGTFLGFSTIAMAEGLRQNGFGRIVSCDPDPDVFARAQEKIAASGLAEWIDHRREPSLSLEIAGPIDLLFCDSLPELREPEVRHFLPRVNPDGLILMHDASSHLRVVRDSARRLEEEGLISAVLLPTPRGLVVAQKRAGRTP